MKLTKEEIMERESILDKEIEENQDHMEDIKEKIRETKNEIDDGALDTYIDDNYEELSREFCCEDYNDEFREYAKNKFKEQTE